MKYSTLTQYRPEVDGLRAVAVLAVMGFHAFPRYFSGGFLGVDIFFVISGFLITYHIISSLADHSFTLLEFYSRRIKRIFPALILVLICAVFFGSLILLPHEISVLAKHSTAASLFLSNFLLYSEIGYFDGAAQSKPLLHLWSLAVEEHFYVFWPLILIAFARLKNYLIIAVLLIILTSFLAQYYSVY